MTPVDRITATNGEPRPAWVTWTALTGVVSIAGLSPTRTLEYAYAVRTGLKKESA
jgi:hypothetical protein